MQAAGHAVEGQCSSRGPFPGGRDTHGLGHDRPRSRAPALRLTHTLLLLLLTAFTLRAHAQDQPLSPGPAQTPAQAQSLARPYTPVGVDLLMQGRPAEGLLILHSGYRNSPYVDADAVVFVGASQSGREGDVLSVNLGFREPHGYAQGRVGRFVLSTGAVRPVQIDGASVLGRAPTGSTLQVFGGMPVVPELGPRAFDWLAGARLGQWLLDQRVGAGVSYLQRRDGGERSGEEVGADLSLTPLSWLGVNAIGSWDLLHDGLAEARLSANAHVERSSAQLFASRRVASRLLPATSLFSVISEAPSSELGAGWLWNAFPRLDLGGEGALEALDHALGYRVALRTTLRFSDQDGGQLGLEATRRKLGREGWSGGSVRVELPINARLRTHAGLELVGADHPAGRGALWPWTRVGASYALGSAWLLAAALSARSTPQYRSELYALLRVSYSATVTP